MDNVRLCPFCKKKVEIEEKWGGFCVEHAEETDCDIKSIIIDADNELDAIFLWNYNVSKLTDEESESE